MRDSSLDQNVGYMYRKVQLSIYYSVTTVPLSVCYGALNLFVCVEASNFAPYACGRW